MTLLRSLALASTLTVTLTACAQTPPAQDGADHSAHHPPGATAPAPSDAPADRMARMDRHMKAMHEMQQKMSRAATPQERQALMAEHMKLMHEGMAMMRGMGSGMGGGMGGGMRGMGPMGAASAPTDMSLRLQMLEKRMDMMQSMMQMMMDRTGPPPVRP